MSSVVAELVGVEREEFVAAGACEVEQYDEGVGAGRPVACGPDEPRRLVVDEGLRLRGLGGRTSVAGKGLGEVLGVGVGEGACFLGPVVEGVSRSGKLRRPAPGRRDARLRGRTRLAHHRATSLLCTGLESGEGRSVAVTTRPAGQHRFYRRRASCTQHRGRQRACAAFRRARQPHASRCATRPRSPGVGISPTSRWTLPHIPPPDDCRPPGLTVRDERGAPTRVGPVPGLVLGNRPAFVGACRVLTGRSRRRTGGRCPSSPSPAA